MECQQFMGQIPRYSVVSNPPEVMQVRDLLHAQPAELTSTHGAGHVVTAAIIHLDNVGTATRAWLDIVRCGGKRGQFVIPSSEFPKEMKIMEAFLSLKKETNLWKSYFCSFPSEWKNSISATRSSNAWKSPCLIQREEVFTKAQPESVAWPEGAEE